MAENKFVLQMLEELSQVGGNPSEGMNRFSYTKENEKALLLVKKWMEAAGMHVFFDRIGNMIGEYDTGNKRTILLGSHIDTVPNGGKYDGTLGVLSAIDAVARIHRGRIPLNHSLRVVVFQDEEGTRFGFGTIGSKFMAGKLLPEDYRRTDASGVSLSEAIAGFPLIDDTFQLEVRKDTAAYLELHIEQGRVLESKGLPAGIVTGIVGIRWLEVIVSGEASHAGTTPMRLRRDALVTASHMIAAIDAVAKKNGECVATVGKLCAFPNAVNVVPGRVRFTIDIRDIDEMTIERVSAQIIGDIKRIAAECSVQATVRSLQYIPPALCDAGIKRVIEEAFVKKGMEPFYLPSGAGHDGMQFSGVLPIGMIFVQSVNGVSHSPLEYTEDQDVLSGVDVLLETILNLDKKLTE